jgi:hypothetical protein
MQRKEWIPKQEERETTETKIIGNNEKDKWRKMINRYIIYYIRISTVSKKERNTKLKWHEIPKNNKS